MKTCYVCGNPMSDDDEVKTEPEEHNKLCSLRIIKEINAKKDDDSFFEPDDGIQELEGALAELSQKAIELKKALKIYDDFSKSNGDWVDDSDEEEGGVPKFVLDARKLLN